MIVDINSYVDRYLNTYIFYHPENFETVGDLSKANTYFSKSFSDATATMKARAKMQQIDAIKINQMDGTKAKVSMDVVDGLSNSNWLEITMQKIAEALNESIEQVYNNSPNNSTFEDILQESQSYKNILESGKASSANITAFFKLIFNTLNKYQNGYNRAFYSALMKIGARLSGRETFSIKGDYYNQAKTLSGDDVQVMKDIIKYLDSAANLLKTEGSVTAKSFGSTITNIFSTAIGERVARDMLYKALVQGMNQTEGALIKAGFKYVSGSPQLAGTKRTEEGRTSKVDIINTEGLNLSVTFGGQIYNIEIGTNLSVKQYGGKEISSIGIVNQTPVSRYLAPGSPERYFSFNILAQSGGYVWPDSFRIMRASLAATFVNEWLMGSGANISGLGVDTAQFLFFNGKIYSMLTIINNICEEFLKLNFKSEYTPVKLHFSGLRQAWITNNSEKPNIPDAVLRSQLVNQVLSKITISAHFNTNILLKYI